MAAVAAAVGTVPADVVDKEDQGADAVFGWDELSQLQDHLAVAIDFSKKPSGTPSFPEPRETRTQTWAPLVTCDLKKQAPAVPVSQGSLMFDTTQYSEEEVNIVAELEARPLFFPKEHIPMRPKKPWKKKKKRKKKKRKKKKKKPRRKDSRSYRKRKRQYKKQMAAYVHGQSQVQAAPEIPKINNPREENRMENLNKDRTDKPREKVARPEGWVTHKQVIDHNKEDSASTLEERINKLISDVMTATEGASQDDVLKMLVRLSHEEDTDDSKTKSGRFRQSSHTSQGNQDICEAVKMTLNQLTGENAQLVKSILKVCHTLHGPSVEFPLLSQLYVLTRLCKGEPLPKLDQQFFRNTFSLVAEGVTDRSSPTMARSPGLVGSFDEYKKLRGGHMEKREDMDLTESKLTRLRDDLVKQYFSCCQVYVVDFLPTLVHRYVKFWLDVKTRQPAPTSDWEKLRRDPLNAKLQWMIRSFFVSRLCHSRTETTISNEHKVLFHLDEVVGPELVFEVVSHVLVLQSRYYVTKKVTGYKYRDYFLFDGGRLTMDNFWMFLPLLFDLQRTMEEWVALDPKHQERVEDANVLPPGDEGNEVQSDEPQAPAEPPAAAPPRGNGIQAEQDASEKNVPPEEEERKEPKKPVHAEKVKASKIIPTSSFHVSHSHVNKTTMVEFLHHLGRPEGSTISVSRFHELLAEFFPVGASLAKRKKLVFEGVHTDGVCATVLLGKPSSKPKGGDMEDQEMEIDEEGEEDGKPKAVTVDEDAEEEAAAAPPPPRKRMRESSSFKDYDPFTVKDFLDAVLGEKVEGKRVYSSWLRPVFIDPGIKHVIKCSDRWNSSGMSHAEYHGIRGSEKTRNRSKGRRERFFEEKEKTKEGTKANLASFEKTSSKTPDLDKFKNHLRALFPVLEDLLEYHQTKAVQSARFKTYVQKQKALEAICDRIYNFGELCHIHNDNIVPIFGDADFMGKGQKRGRLLVPITSLKRLLRRKQRGRKGRLYFLNEFRSSMLCFKCLHALQAMEVKDRDGDNISLHSAKICPNPCCQRKRCNRDDSATSNFVTLFVYKVVFGMEPPVEFRRTKSAAEAAAEGL